MSFAAPVANAIFIAGKYVDASAIGTGKALTYDGTKIIYQTPAGGSGTVTSVALALPNILTVSGSPVTTTGTLTGTLATQTANTIFGGPTTGSAAAPTFRSLVAADIPAIPESGVTNLTSDLAAKAPLASPTFTGTVTATGDLTLTGANAVLSATTSGHGLSAVSWSSGYNLNAATAGDNLYIGRDTAWGSVVLSNQIDLATNHVVNVGLLSLVNGDDSSGTQNKTQAAFGYNNTETYQHWLRSRHNTTGAGNGLDFYTSDGTEAGVFPTNAVLGLTIENGKISSPVVGADNYFTINDQNLVIGPVTAYTPETGFTFGFIDSTGNTFKQIQASSLAILPTVGTTPTATIDPSGNLTVVGLSTLGNLVSDTSLGEATIYNKGISTPSTQYMLTGNSGGTDTALNATFQLHFRIGNVEKGTWDSAALEVTGNVQAVDFNASNAFYFYAQNLAAGFSNAVSPDTGKAWTLTDAGGDTLRQVKASSLVIAATQGGTPTAIINPDGSVEAGSITVQTRAVTGVVADSPGATYSPNVELANQFNITLTENLTLQAPAGTPVDGQGLLFKFLATVGGYTITFDNTYWRTMVGVTIPSIPSGDFYVTAVFNAANSQFDIIGATGVA